MIKTKMIQKKDERRKAKDQNDQNDQNDGTMKQRQTTK